MVFHEKGGKKYFDDELLEYMKYYRHDAVVHVLENIDVKYVVDSTGKTLLHHAVLFGHDTIVEYLINRGFEVDALDNDQNTPLMYALRNRFRSTISKLLKLNADILLCGEGKPNSLQIVLDPGFKSNSIIDEMFFDALKRKFSGDSQQIARILIDVKCSLARAMYFKDVLITKYMLDAGCSVNEHDPKDGFTALHESINYTDSRNVKLLLDHGADVSANNDAGLTPSDYYTDGEKESKDILAALLQHPSFGASTIKGYEFAAKVLDYCPADEVEMVLRHDFDLKANFWNHNRRTLLHVIAENTNAGVMETLKGREFDVHARDAEGRTALWDAAYFSNPNNLEFLLKHGADPNDKNNDGDTALFHGFIEWTSNDCESSVADSLKCVEIMIEYGADVLHANMGKTVFDIPLPAKYAIFIQPAISQLAMIEARGQTLRKGIVESLANNELSKDYLALCRREIGILRKTMINETVSLFQFLTESEEKLLKYVRNNESAEKLRKIMSEQNNSDIFFIKRLRKRVQNILEIAKLRKNAASIISTMSGCNNQDVIENIVSFLDKQSLQNLYVANVVFTNAVE